MDEFRTIARLWPSGTEIDLGTDSNVLGGPATLSRNAATYATSPDGTQNYQFLFWNTGRHTTGKRRVRWNFSVLGWGTWTATRWYGIPSGGGPGASRVRADAFTIGGDAPMMGTPIDASSTYAPGSWPLAGDDHVIGTTAGPASVVAKDPYPGPASSTYDFAGWLALTWGGDPSGEYVESDAGTSGTFGGTGYYEHVIGGAYPVPQGTSADLIATYGTHNSGISVIDPRKLWELIYEVLGDPRVVIPQRGDPSPGDLIRLKLLEQLMEKARPGVGQGTDFQTLIENAPKMSRDDLKRSLQSLNTTLELGKAAQLALDVAMKRSER